MDDEVVSAVIRRELRASSQTGQPARTATLGVDHYVWAVRRQWYLIAAITLLGIALAAAYLVLTPRVAVATTTVNINVIMTEPFSSQRPASGLLDASTETALARSHIVAERAVEILGNDLTPADLRELSEIETGASATVLRITFEAPSQREAEAGANAIAEAYLATRSDQANARVATIVESITEQIDALNSTLNETNKTITSASPSSSEYVQALTRQQQVLTELEGLLAERNALRSVDTTGGIVLSAAENTPVYFTPARGQTLMLGTGTGFILGIILAFVRSPFDRRVRSSKELSWLMQAPVLTRWSGARISADAALRIAEERLLSEVSPGDTILLFDVSQSRELSITTKLLATRLESGAYGLGVLTPKVTDAAAVIAALRSADAAAIVFDRKSRHTNTSRWFIEEASAQGIPLLGVIEPAVPHETAPPTHATRRQSDTDHMSPQKAM